MSRSHRAAASELARAHLACCRLALTGCNQALHLGTLAHGHSGGLRQRKALTGSAVVVDSSTVRIGAAVAASSGRARRARLRAVLVRCGLGVCRSSGRAWGARRAGGLRLLCRPSRRFMLAGADHREQPAIPSSPVTLGTSIAPITPVTPTTCWVGLRSSHGASMPAAGALGEATSLGSAELEDALRLDVRFRKVRGLARFGLVSRRQVGMWVARKL